MCAGGHRAPWLPKTLYRVARCQPAWYLGADTPPECPESQAPSVQLRSARILPHFGGHRSSNCLVGSGHDRKEVHAMTSGVAVAEHPAPCKNLKADSASGTHAPSPPPCTAASCAGEALPLPACHVRGNGQTSLLRRWGATGLSARQR